MRLISAVSGVQVPASPPRFLWGVPQVICKIQPGFIHLLYQIQIRLNFKFQALDRDQVNDLLAENTFQVWENPEGFFIFREICFQPPDSESRYPFLNPTDYPEDFLAE